MNEGLKMHRHLDELYDHIPEYFQEIYFRDWSGYEEYGHMVIVQHTETGRFYIHRWNYSVMCNSQDNPMIWQPMEVTEEEAIQEMIEYDESCDENDKNFRGF
jgi:hypothetical protein